MSVRLRKWKDQEGRMQEAWVVDVKFRHPDARIERVRQVSPVPTRRGAEQFERKLRDSLLDGSFGKEEKPEKTLADFCESFLIYSTNNNKPSAVYAKQISLKKHLLPFFARMKLKDIGIPEVERFKAEKLKKGLAPKSINNHLGVLRKMLNLAVEWRELPYAPKVKQLRVPLQEFRFLNFEEAERFFAAADAR